MCTNSEGRPGRRPNTKRNIRRNRTTLLRLVTEERHATYRGEYPPIGVTETIDDRVCNLRIAADRLIDGRTVDPLWLRAQLLDLAESLVVGRG